MSLVLGSLAVLAGMGPLLAAMATVLGLGIVRLLPSWILAVSALALVVLPWLGIASFFRSRLTGLAVGSWVWPATLLGGIPLYLPQERADAFLTGMAHFAAPIPPEHQEKVISLSKTVATFLETERLAGTEPPPEATPEETVTTLPSVKALPDAEDAVALPFEGTDNQRRVSVVLEGSEGHTREVQMVFDTGASLTTVDRQTLALLRKSPEKDAPTLELHTANGMRRDPVVLLDRLWIGGMPVEGVTVAACDACAPEGTVGLLGLNVSGMFHVTLDPERQEIVLQPRGDLPNRLSDVAPWVGLSGTVHSWSDGRVEMEVEAKNRSMRPMARVTVSMDCGGSERFRTDLHQIDPGEQESTRVSLPRWTECDPGIFSLRSASW